MFDARSLFEQMVRGAQPNQSGSGHASSRDGMSELGDLLRQFTQAGTPAGQNNAGTPAGQNNTGTPAGQNSAGTPASQQSAGTAAATQSPAAAQGGGMLDELLRQFTETSRRPGNVPAGQGRGSGGNPLEDLLRQFTQQQSGSSRNAAPVDGSGQTTGGGLGDILGQVFGGGGQAQAAQPGSTEPASGQMPDLRQLIEKFGADGAASGDLMRQLSDFIGNNKIGTGAALGGLGALIFGTQTGRSIAMSAAKVGALAIVGGLAYKAYQNYSQGRPAVSGPLAPEAAPRGTGFEAEEVTNDAAITYIRGMIAASAADGRIDQAEHQKLIGALSQQGIDAEAEEFLANELNNPASIDELAAGVSNQTEGLQLYTAARIAIEPDTGGEQQFLSALANRLGIPTELRAHVDAAARGVA